MAGDPQLGDKCRKSWDFAAPILNMLFYLFDGDNIDGVASTFLRFMDSDQFNSFVHIGLQQPTFVKCGIILLNILTVVLSLLRFAVQWEIRTCLVC